MEKLILNEDRELSYHPTALEKEAGIEVFADYGDVNILETLSNGNPLLWDEIMNLPYERVFVQLLLNKDKREYAERYRILVKAQHEPN